MRVEERQRVGPRPLAEPVGQGLVGEEPAHRTRNVVHPLGIEEKAADAVLQHRGNAPAR